MKGKIKSILPSLREKKRYVAYTMLTDKKINDDTAKKAINSYIMKFMGELGYAKAGIIMLDHKNNAGVIKTSHIYVDEIKTALALIDNIDNNAVNIRSTYVSGLLNRSRSKMEVN